MPLGKRERYWKRNKFQVKKLEREQTEPNDDDDHAPPETTTQQRLVPQSLNITEQHHHSATPVPPEHHRMSSPLPANHCDRVSIITTPSVDTGTPHIQSNQHLRRHQACFLLNNLAVAANHKNFQSKRF
jgi:hypothetical protein